MKAEERRKNITLLLSADKPVPGGVLSQKLGVSRQIIVQDIARLKEAGYEILATHTGYLLKSSPLAERVLQVFHTTEQTEDELSCIVSLGGTVADVHVWHKVYGKLSAPLNVFLPQHVKQFIEEVRTGSSVELMHITGGHHCHTVRADCEDTLDKIEAALREKGYLLQDGR